MKRILIYMALSALFCSSAEAALTYDTDWYLPRRSAIGSGSLDDIMRRHLTEVDSFLDGTTGVPLWIFTPTTQPASTEGTVYYDAAGNNLKLRTDAAWVDIDVSGASSLDAAYGIGAAITVDAGAVTLTATDAANNDALTVVQSDTAGASALVITNAGTGASIEIDGAGTGDDITGTGDLWTISEAGVASLAGIILGGTDMVMENAETFNNVDDDVIEFSSNDKEDFEIDLSGTNIIKFTSDTSAITLEFDVLDRFTGVEDITFDAEAGNISLTADAGNEDLTIAQAGAVDASLILTSEGTGTDALSLITTNAAGDISLVSADNITRTAADNITDVTTDGGYTLTIGGSTNGKYISTVADTYSLISVDALTIQNTEAAKNITVNSVGGSIYIEAEEDIADAVLITADGGTTTSLKIHNDTGNSVTEGAGSIEILSDVGGVEIHSSANLAKAIQIVADGGATESIYVQADQGTAASSTTQTDAAIQLVADVGGIGLYSALAAADAVRIEAGGTDGQITVQNILGTTASATTEEDASIQLYSEVGGIGLSSALGAVDAIRIEASAALGAITIQNIAGVAASATTEEDASIQLYSQVGGISLSSGLAAVDAIRIESSGADGQITVQSIAGTTAAATTETDASIQLYSAAGGVSLVSGLAAVDAIRLEATAAAAQITVQNKLGTTAAAATEVDASIQLYSEVGGIGLQSKLNGADAIRLEANGGVNETINIHANQGTGAASINLLSDAGGITLNAGSGGVVFTQGQTRKQFFTPKDVELDGTTPPTLGDIGTDAQANVSTLSFDADGGATGDMVAYVMWHVPDGYVTDSARLNIAYSFSTAEDAADEAQFDFTVNAIAQNEAIDAAGTALADQTTVIADASTDNGNIHTSQYNIEVEVIAIDDYVIIEIAVDESASALSASNTLDVHYFEIEWESTE